jgi:3-deoxy-D-manno-octulosonic-acid transferase
MLWLYRLLFLPFLLAMTPVWLVHILRRGGYGDSFWQRFGFFPRLPDPSPGRRRIWIHAASVGEVRSLAPLVEKLAPVHDLVITASSSTGLRQARDLYGSVAVVGVFPLDFWTFSRRTWNRIQPDLVLNADGELWPEHLHRARCRRIPLCVINARLSDRSFRRQKRFPNVAKWLWEPVNAIFSGGSGTTKQLRTLGISPGKIFELGNLKCDRPVLPPLSASEREKLLGELGIQSTEPGGPPVLVGCSTWPGEEALLLTILRRLREKNDRWRMVLIPRHGERRKELQNLLRGERCHFHSTGEAEHGDVSVAVVDTVGELAHVIRVGTVAFLGKTLPPNDGAQSPLDAIAAGVPLVSGPNGGNFLDILRDLQTEGAISIGSTADEVTALLESLAMDPSTREEMAERGREWLTKNGGTAARLAKHVQEFLQ